MTLRPYQVAMLEAARAELRQHRSVVMVAPCGSGKGTIVTYMVKRAVERGKPVIFAVHGVSLVEDMDDRVTKLGIPHGVIMGSKPQAREHLVQVTSIDTLYRMKHPPQAALLIIDEAHMALSKTWRKVVERYPGSKVVGLTATPIRLDKQGLGTESGGLFDAMICGPNERDLISQGMLVGSRVFCPPAPNTDGIKKTAGEFNMGAAAAMLDQSTVVGDIVSHWMKHAGGRKTAAFGVNQKHAHHIMEQFRAAGVEWAYVDAETPLDERRRIWRDLDHGSLSGVSSVGCIATGWDHSIVSCLICARPTASLGLWHQQLGRGSRIHPGKENFVVMDHAGNTRRHEPYGIFESEIEWSLNGAAVKKGDEEKCISTTRCDKVVVIDGKKWLPCYRVFETGPDACPHCGCPVKKRVVEIKTIDGELTEYAAPAAVLVPESVQSAVWDALVARTILKKYKPGYASMVFKAKYGRWPKRAWQEKLRERMRA
jgi:superfamily II DNA or RNA helicase